MTGPIPRGASRTNHHRPPDRRRRARFLRRCQPHIPVEPGGTLVRNACRSLVSMRARVCACVCAPVTLTQTLETCAVVFHAEAAFDELVRAQRVSGEFSAAGVATALGITRAELEDAASDAPSLPLAVFATMVACAFFDLGLQVRRKRCVAHALLWLWLLLLFSSFVTDRDAPPTVFGRQDLFSEGELIFAKARTWVEAAARETGLSAGDVIAATQRADAIADAAIDRLTT